MPVPTRCRDQHPPPTFFSGRVNIFPWPYLVCGSVEHPKIILFPVFQAFALYLNPFSSSCAVSFRDLGFLLGAFWLFFQCLPLPLVFLDSNFFPSTNLQSTAEPNPPRPALGSRFPFFKAGCFACSLEEVQLSCFLDLVFTLLADQVIFPADLKKAKRVESWFYRSPRYFSQPPCEGTALGLQGDFLSWTFYMSSVCALSVRMESPPSFFPRTASPLEWFSSCFFFPAFWKVGIRFLDRPWSHPGISRLSDLEFRELLEHGPPSSLLVV